MSQEQSDDDNQAIQRLLGIIVDEFSLRDAMDAKTILTPFDYHLHKVELSQKEQEDYNKLRWLPWVETRMKYSGFAEIAIHKARRIVRSAGDKIPDANLIGKEFDVGDSWLVYCDNSKMLNKMIIWQKVSSSIR